MSTENENSYPLQHVVEVLQLCGNPKDHAAEWDNVGLLIEPTGPKNVSHILITNDLTESVMEEALVLNVDMIVSYHPPIFEPLKKLTAKSWKERIAVKCIENKIAVYSPHTAFDAVRGGVNDWLAAAFSPDSSTPIEPGSRPECGMGRLCVLDKYITVEEAVELVKKRTGLSHVRLARCKNSDGRIKTVAICAGSGTSVLKKASAHLFVTGEMQHHDILDVVHKGTHVILTNHSESERGFLQNVFSKKLKTLLDGVVKVTISEQDEDPLRTV